MKTRAVLVLASIAGAAGSVFGQAQTNPPIKVTYTIEWEDVIPTGPATAPWQTYSVGGNGQVDPGEGVRFLLRLNFDPPVGTPVTWAQTLWPNSSGSGLVHAFWNGAMDLRGDSGAATAAGTWSDNTTTYHTNLRRRTIAPFTAAGTVGWGATGEGGARITNIQPAQFGLIPLNPANNALFWQGLWIPNSYSARTVTWALIEDSVGIDSAMMAFEDPNAPDPTIPVALRANYNFGSLGIQIVPSPSSLALLGLGALVAARRRR